MTASIWVLFWAACVLLCSTSVLSKRTKHLPQIPTCPDSKGMHMSDNARKRIFKELSNWLPKNVKYDCYLEKQAAITIARPNRIRTSEEDGTDELSHEGPWRPSFIEDVVRWWSPIIERMKNVENVGCFYMATERDKGTAMLVCVFESPIRDIPDED